MRTRKRYYMGLFMLVCLLLGVARIGTAMDNPQTIVDTITQAKTLDEQLAVFNQLGNLYPSELGAGLWDLPLDVTPAESIDSLQIPPTFDNAVEDSNVLSMDMQGMKLIVLHNKQGRTMLCGQVMARLPQVMRATTMAEATTVLYLTHFIHKDYIFYQIYQWNPGDKTIYALPSELDGIPLHGYQELQNGADLDQQFWSRICTYLYPENLRLSQGGINYSAQQTGAACYLNYVSLDNISESHLVTPTTIEGLPVVGIGELNNIDVDQVDVSEGTLWLTSGAFSKIHNLRAVTLPSSLRYIGYDAFAGCRTLLALALPEGLETCDPNALNGCTNLRRLYLPSTLRMPLDLSDCSCVTVYTPEGSAAMLDAQRQGIPTVACASAESITALSIIRSDSALYGLLDGEGILLDYSIRYETTEIPSEIDGVPIRELAQGALNLSDNFSHPKLVLPEGLRKIQTGALQLPTGCNVYLPASLVSLTSADLATYNVYAQPNSTVYQLANGAARQTIACDNVESFLKAESMDDFWELSILSRNWSLDRKLLLIHQAVDSFSQNINPEEELKLKFYLPQEVINFLPKNWGNLKATKVKKLPKALTGKKTLIVEANVSGLGIHESYYILGDFMAKLPPTYMPQTTDDVECIVVIRARAIESGYKYFPDYTSFHRYYDVYAFAPGGKKVYDLYQIRNLAKKEGLKSEINGDEVPIEDFWPIFEKLFP